MDLVQVKQREITNSLSTLFISVPAWKLKMGGFVDRYNMQVNNNKSTGLFTAENYRLVKKPTGTTGFNLPLGVIEKYFKADLPYLVKVYYSKTDHNIYIKIVKPGRGRRPLINIKIWSI